MHRSRMAAELTGADINEPAVLSHFFREQQAEAAATDVAAVTTTNDSTMHAHH
jgi:ribose transport system ATP-binding protein